MGKRLERYTTELTFLTTDDELRARCPEYINVFYGFNTYSGSVQHIKELADAIRVEYPNMSDEDMEINYITHTSSIRHAGYTTLCVPIPIEDFLRLRHNLEIGIL